jgi:excisionase family DNA binding protein
VTGLPRILTTDEVAALYRVDRKTVVRWCARGRLRGFKTPGGDWRVPADAVDPRLLTSLRGKR